MSDPVAGIREMARVTREDGVVAACVWDLAGGGAPLSVFWNAARQLDPAMSIDESKLAGAREGHLAELFEAAGLREVEDGAISIAVEHATFDEWWEPFTSRRRPGRRARRRSRRGRARRAARVDVARLLPDAPFTMHARAWAARGVV